MTLSAFAAELGKIATIIHQVHLSMDGDQSQIRMLKTILDSFDKKKETDR